MIAVSVFLSHFFHKKGWQGCSLIFLGQTKKSICWLYSIPRESLRSRQRCSLFSSGHDHWSVLRQFIVLMFTVGEDEFVLSYFKPPWSLCIKTACCSVVPKSELSLLCALGIRWKYYWQTTLITDLLKNVCLYLLDLLLQNGRTRLSLSLLSPLIIWFLIF